MWIVYLRIQVERDHDIASVRDDYTSGAVSRVFLLSRHAWIRCFTIATQVNTVLNPMIRFIFDPTRYTYIADHEQDSLDVYAKYLYLRYNEEMQLAL